MTDRCTEQHHEDTGANVLDLYGVRLMLPFPPPPMFARQSIEEPNRAVTLDPEPMGPITRADWASADEMQIRVERLATSTRIDLASDRFTIGPGYVGFQSPNVGAAFDRNHNVLMAMILPYVEMCALHANVVDLPNGRVAILGESGAGKTTLGGELLERNGRLISDDLLALDAVGMAHDGPPFRRLVSERPGTVRDLGGKFRLAVPPVARPPAPVNMFVVLDNSFPGPTPLRGVAALDPLLARPYSPVPSRSTEPLLRLSALSQSIERASVLALPPRWRSPAEMADTVVTFMD